MRRHSPPRLLEKESSLVSTQRLLPVPVRLAQKSIRSACRSSHNAPSSLQRRVSDCHSLFRTESVFSFVFFDCKVLEEIELTL